MIRMGITYQGSIWKFRDDIDTDIIIPTQYGALGDVEKMVPYAFEPLRPNLPALVKEGDIFVAGKNFGCGSSREIAPEIIAMMGVRCIIAKSFARIFYRNAVNNGLLLIENITLIDECREGDTIKVDTDIGILYGEKVYPIPPYPEHIMNIIESGGLLKMMQKMNGLEAV